MKRKILSLALALAVCMGLVPEVKAAPSGGYNLTPTQAELYLDKLLTTRDEHLESIWYAEDDIRAQYAVNGLVAAKLLDLDRDGVPVLFLASMGSVGYWSYSRIDSESGYQECTLHFELWKAQENALYQITDQSLFYYADKWRGSIRLYHGAEEDALIYYTWRAWGDEKSLDVEYEDRVDHLYGGFETFLDEPIAPSWNGTDITSEQARQYFDEYLGKSEMLIDLTGYLTDLPTTTAVQADIQETVSTLCQYRTPGWYLKELRRASVCDHITLPPQQAAAYAQELRKMTNSAYIMRTALFDEGNGNTGVIFDKNVGDSIYATSYILEYYDGGVHEFGSPSSCANIYQDYIDRGYACGGDYYFFKDGRIDFSSRIGYGADLEDMEFYKDQERIPTEEVEAILNEMPKTLLYSSKKPTDVPVELVIAALEAYAVTDPATVPGYQPIPGLTVLFTEGKRNDAGISYFLTCTNTSDKPIQGTYGLLTYNSPTQAQFHFFDLDIPVGGTALIERNSIWYNLSRSNMLWLTFDSVQEREDFIDASPIQRLSRETSYYPVDFIQGPAFLRDTFGIQ